MDFAHSEKTQDYIARVKAFMDEHVYPVEEQMYRETEELNPTGDWTKWQMHPFIEPLKKKAQQAGLWNLFLPDDELGQGLTTLEYAPLAEEMGRVLFASEIFNCNAPDTGNMEVLYHFGNEQQKDQWLKPLLAGEIRSVFGMTEPDVASSDATNMQATVEVDGDELVLNGKKWWSTGLGHPNAKVTIFMALSNPENNKHSQHSMVIVPLDTPGIEIKRMLSAYGDFDAPSGHGEMHFTDVRVPKENLLVGLGQGFAIAQGRLGPGRIHHCMRSIGAAEKALELAMKRSMSRSAFGKPLLKLGGNGERIAQARIAIHQARLMTLHAAWKIDEVGVKNAMTEISAIKVAVPKMLQDVVDMSVQLHGGAGMCSDFPLARFAAGARALRLADGPDEVHMGMVTRLELKKYT
ncbi:acyl-CoA dehydrogenase family member 11 [Paraglaciecola mesophila KMM 241]|uniref:Acyl-CoA dehydrogenase family member 11 n=1 Tax=Paraglaciecola mesophila KMM 241 TaxID=1128912 RepID=K6ZGW8_9ALTE|nr:acyl-CoA dehydrogenase family protein [Paraglaciecola mesophila]GAC22625.1 acyl-CoA dehydrogenase family member 11 [Paraglaciecola mesophila KMM 241]|tara:strand:+ start:1023 stop:2243 length:1221 start_codon:yes stop_codon:yes gene_type:complete